VQNHAMGFRTPTNKLFHQDHAEDGVYQSGATSLLRQLTRHDPVDGMIQVMPCSA
jgi:hypothetical protein